MEGWGKIASLLLCLNRALLDLNGALQGSLELRAPILALKNPIDVYGIPKWQGLIFGRN